MRSGATNPLDDGPDDPLGAGRRGEGAHVAVVDAGPRTESEYIKGRRLVSVLMPKHTHIVFKKETFILIKLHTFTIESLSIIQYGIIIFNVYNILILKSV